MSAAIASPMSFTRSSPNLVDLGKGGARATQRRPSPPFAAPERTSLTQSPRALESMMLKICTRLSATVAPVRRSVALRTVL